MSNEHDKTDRLAEIKERLNADRLRIYKSWHNMKTRCSNVNAIQYKRYGGRGITYCKEWECFEIFYTWAIANGYSDTLTLERIDVNGAYCPENCRWASRKEQARNRRDTNLVFYKGQAKTKAEWSEITGMCEGTILSRLKNGWSVEDAIEKPVAEWRGGKYPHKNYAASWRGANG